MWLLVCAAPKEMHAMCKAFGVEYAAHRAWEVIKTGTRFELMMSGVGKSNAAGAVARVLDPARHQVVMSIGIAGALPDSGCELGDVIGASASIFADEGIQTPTGFESCAQMGFAPFENETDAQTHDQCVIKVLTPYCDHIGPIACVSMCSGTDERASAVASHTGALAEAMEGAAVSLSAHRVDPTILTGELRVISNTTGSREDQRWDLQGSLDRLQSVLGRIASELR